MSGLVPVSALPAAMRGLFPYEHLNRMQSEVFEYAFGSDASLVVSSPTGSGKTAVLDLALARMWTLRDWPAGSKPVAVYMAPLKAITHERSTDWQAKLTPLGLRCCELTGDTGNSPADLAALRDADLIVTTPEKWDAVTRSRSDGQSMISRVALFLIDEIHLLAEEGRGPTLEAVVARMKLISLSEMLGDTPLRWLRFVAISATIANIDDIARWLHPQCAVATFDSSYRPVPLQWHVEAHDMRITYTFDAQLASRLWPVVRKHSGGRPALVFCNSRKTADLAAQASLTRSSPNSARPGFPRVFSLASPSHFAPPPPPQYLRAASLSRFCRRAAPAQLSRGTVPLPCCEEQDPGWQARGAAEARSGLLSCRAQCGRPPCAREALQRGCAAHPLLDERPRAGGQSARSSRRDPQHGALRKGRLHRVHAHRDPADGGACGSATVRHEWHVRGDDAQPNEAARLAARH